MKKKSKLIKAIISIILCFACVWQPVSALAATFTGRTYIKEMILSYGETEDEAKSWLTGKGYKVLDYNLNEGADDVISTKRAVYIGYKTTSNADEAITDMKLMNMDGAYSVEDYQQLLSEQKTNIQTFIENFKVSINEYRTNYNNGQERAKAAHDLLNLMYDDDTEEDLGDLLLNKIREEYTDDEYNALSDDEKSKVADLTTILMQSNGTSVLAIEQLIALATDSSSDLWTERYEKAPTYNMMVEDLMDSENLTFVKAEQKLAQKYDVDAKAIASKISDYKDYLKSYTDSGVKFSSAKSDFEVFKNKNDADTLAAWTSAGTQYETLASLKNVSSKDWDDLADVSLLDLLISDDYDVENDDRQALYPLVSVLTDGQRACLDFLPLYQIVSMGINGDNSIQKAMEAEDIDEKDNGSISIYDGVDRTIFNSDVALTSDAIALENSSKKNVEDNWFNTVISKSTKILYIAFGVSTIATIATFSVSSHFAKEMNEAIKTATTAEENIMFNETIEEVGADNILDMSIDEMTEGEAQANNLLQTSEKAVAKIGKTRFWNNVFKYAGIAMTAITIVIMGISLWKTYEDLQKYYKTEFTPIPSHMVSQGVDENDNKTYTYYTPVKCNREEQGMVTDNTKVLKGYGDINGDVGRQWVALYTTTDSAAGNPITAKDFIVQYGNSEVPNDTCTALSMFCENVAQNLTNKSAGYTYADSKDGIYLFYGTDASAFAASAFSNGVYAAIGGGALLVFGIASYFITMSVKKKKANGKEKTNA